MSNEQDYPFFASTKWQKETKSMHTFSYNTVT